MNLENASLIRLEEDTIIKPFDCGDVDLNDFLFNKAKKYLKENLATTFIIEDESITIAYYSIFNDSLKVEKSKFASNSQLKKFLKNLVTHNKRHLKNFPAIKIGRLAVSNNIQTSGLGKMIVNSIIDYAITVNQKCGCKLITVDAYSKSTGFYTKLGFQFLSAEDFDLSERQMYLDITAILNAES